MTSQTLLLDVSQSCSFCFSCSFFKREYSTSSTVSPDRRTVSRLMSVLPREMCRKIFQVWIYNKSITQRWGRKETDTSRINNIRQCHSYRKPQASIKIETLSKKIRFSKVYVHIQLWNNINATKDCVSPNIGVELRARTGRSEHSRNLTTWGLVPPRVSGTGSDTNLGWNPKTQPKQVLSPSAACRP